MATQVRSVNVSSSINVIIMMLSQVRQDILNCGLMPKDIRLIRKKDTGKYLFKSNTLLLLINYPVLIFH